MGKIIVFLVFVLVLSLVLLGTSGCVSDDEICNYDGICTNDETDNCADCQNVLGRAVSVPKEYQNPHSSP